MDPGSATWLNAWLRRGKRGRASAVVLGGSVNGLSFARSLGRHGVPTLMLDSERYLGTYSRYADFGLLPPARDRPEAWLAVLEHAGARLERPAVLFATSDEHTLFVAENAPALAARFRFVTPSLETTRGLLDKHRQYAVARDAGIAVPDTRLLDSEQAARDAADAMAYPCLLKPCVSHLGRRALGGRKVLVVHSPAELMGAYRRLAGGPSHFMAQEIIPGGDSAIYWYLTFLDAAGGERAWITGRKLRQYPPLFGNGSLSVTIEAPRVADLSRRLLEALRLCGYAAIEFKLDARDGGYKLMEINPRSDSFNQMAIGAGVDFPWLGYRYLAGEAAGPVHQPPPFRLGLRYVDEEQDVLAFLALRKAGALTLPQWLRSLGGSRPMTAAWDDPAPLLAGVGRMLRACVRPRDS
jgi:predicted ATP-grasp superfamily ATP-dependent carboligase